MKSIQNIKTLTISIFILALFATTASAEQADINPNPTPSSCLNLSVGLGYRSRDAYTGGQVSDLQDFLQSHNYMTQEPTGYFGQLTVVAVKKFQGDNGLSKTGFVGSLTRQKIKSKSCVTITAPIMPVTPIVTTPVAPVIVPIVATTTSIVVPPVVVKAPNTDIAVTAFRATDGNVHINATFDTNVYNPNYVTLKATCPAGVVISVGNDICGGSPVQMDQIGGPGAYRNIFLFSNTSGSAQTVKFEVSANAIINNIPHSGFTNSVVPAN